MRTIFLGSALLLAATACSFGEIRVQDVPPGASADCAFPVAEGTTTECAFLVVRPEIEGESREPADEVVVEGAPVVTVVATGRSACSRYQNVCAPIWQIRAVAAGSTSLRVTAPIGVFGSTIEASRSVTVVRR